MYYPETPLSPSPTLIAALRHTIANFFSKIWLKSFVSVLGTVWLWISNAFIALGALFDTAIYTIIALLTIDFLTGVVRSIKDPFDRFSSDRARKGIMKIVFYTVIIILLQLVIRQWEIFQKLQFFMYLYIVMVELVSIFENVKIWGIPFPDLNELPSFLKDMKAGKIDLNKYRIVTREKDKDTPEFKRLAAYTAMSWAVDDYIKRLKRRRVKLSRGEHIQHELKVSFEKYGASLFLTPECVKTVWNGLAQTQGSLWDQVNAIYRTTNGIDLKKRQTINVLEAAKPAFKQDISYLAESHFRFSKKDPVYSRIHNNNR